MLTDLHSDMVKFLHAKKLSQIRLSLLLVVLEVVNVLQTEVLKLFFELLNLILDLLHD